MSGDAILDRLLEALEDQLDAAVQLRRDLHAEPELGNREHRTKRRLQQALAPLGGGHEVVGTALIATVGHADQAAVALRAELDGLPVTEESGASYRSTNGRMHACGHDVHMAALTAVCLAAAQVELPRPLAGVFQPSEETYPSGAQQMVDAGLLTDQRIGAMVGVHLHPDPAAGEVSVGAGTINASSDEFRIIVSGEGGHGAYPHRTRDPVLALSHIVVALQQIVSRRTDPMHSAVVGVGTLQAGSAPNVVPAEAEATGTLRSLQPEDRAAVLEHVEDIAIYMAGAHGCSATIEFTEGEPALVNDPGLVAQLEPTLARADLSPGAVMRSCGADDFGFFAEQIPAAMLFLGFRPREEPAPSLHHPTFLPGDEAVAATARALAASYVGAAGFLDGPGAA